MLESLITLPPPSGPEPIEPDYPYNEDTMLRVIKNPVQTTMTYGFFGSPMTIHYGDQNSAAIATLSGNDKFSIPASVTEFFLKQVTPDRTLDYTQITNNEITEVTWNPALKTYGFDLQDCEKLTKVSPYLPLEVTNIMGLFYNAYDFNQDISMWDFSNIVDMSYAFLNARRFNQDLSGWDISNVTNRTNYDTGTTAWQADFKPRFN